MLPKPSYCPYSKSLHVLSPCWYGHLHLYHKTQIELRDTPDLPIFQYASSKTSGASTLPKIYFPGSIYTSPPANRLPIQLPSFLYSEQYLSFTNLFNCSTFSCCRRFLSFLHQYVAQRSPTVLSNKMASTQ